eukprot:1962047-Prymnesium_polylepis.1
MILLRPPAILCSAEALAGCSAPGVARQGVRSNVCTLFEHLGYGFNTSLGQVFERANPSIGQVLEQGCANSKIFGPTP